MIQVPHAPVAWPLLAFLPGIWLLARWLLGNLDRLARRILTPVLAIAVFVLSTHVLSLLTHSFFIGMPIACIGLGILGYCTLLKPPAKDPSLASMPLSFWIVLVVSTIFISMAVIGYDFYDEDTVPGHQSNASQILDGFYPPRYLAEPSLELRYHYGFDILSATTELLTQLRIDQAIDVNTLLLWMLLLTCIWLVGERMFSSGSGTIAAILVPWGAGLTFLGTPTRYPYMGNFSIHRARMALPLVNNFFQRPWSVGIPALCLALMLVLHCVRSGRREKRALLALGITLASLAILEAVVFATAILCCGIYLLWVLARERKLHVFEVGVVALIAGIVGSRTHGLFVPLTRDDAGIAHTGLHWALRAGGIAGGLWRSIAWNLLSFGVRLPLGIAGIWFCRARCALWGVIMIISAIMLNTFMYAFSNDIIKFATLASIPLSFGTAAVLRFTWQRWTWSRAVIVILIPLICAQGLLMAGSLWTHHPTNAQVALRPYLSLDYPVSSDDAHAITWLRTQVRPPENMYRIFSTKDGTWIANDYSSWGGLPIVYSEPWDAALGMPEDTQQRRLMLFNLLNSVRDDPTHAQADHFIDILRGEGVVWMVVGPDDPWLLPPLQVRVNERTAREVNRFGDIRIFKLK